MGAQLTFKEHMPGMWRLNTHRSPHSRMSAKSPVGSTWQIVTFVPKGNNSEIRFVLTGYIFSAKKKNNLNLFI